MLSVGMAGRNSHREFPTSRTAILKEVKRVMCCRLKGCHRDTDIDPPIKSNSEYRIGDEKVNVLLSKGAPRNLAHRPLVKA